MTVPQYTPALPTPMNEGSFYLRGSANRFSRGEAVMEIAQSDFHD